MQRVCIPLVRRFLGGYTVRQRFPRRVEVLQVHTFQSTFWMSLRDSWFAASPVPQLLVCIESFHRSLALRSRRSSKRKHSRKHSNGGAAECSCTTTTTTTSPSLHSPDQISAHEYLQREEGVVCKEGKEQHKMQRRRHLLRRQHKMQR